MFITTVQRQLIGLVFGLIISCTSANAMPAGNYQDSCTDCYVRHHVLRCQCRTKNQYIQKTAIQLHPHCRYIQNFNGYLTCTFRPGHHLRGSFHATCYHCRSNGFRLTCICQRRNQSERRSTLRYADSCSYIVNHNGRLVCRR